MLRALYDWTLSLAARKTAVLWLAAIAFIESSVFLIPADVLFLPMGLARPERAYRYAMIATLASRRARRRFSLGVTAFTRLSLPRRVRKTHVAARGRPRCPDERRGAVLG